MEFIVYAAGPIAGCSYETCTDWRAVLQQKFDALVKTGDRIRVASPMRAKEYLKGTIVTSEFVANVSEPYQKATASARAIMQRDFFDCTRANLIFVNFLGATKVSIGTVMECAWAFAKKIPVIIVMERDSPHRHPMIEEAGLVVEDFDTAVLAAANFLLPNISGTCEVSPLQGIAAPLNPWPSICPLQTIGPLSGPLAPSPFPPQDLDLSW